MIEAGSEDVEGGREGGRVGGEEGVVAWLAMRRRRLLEFLHG